MFEKAQLNMAMQLVDVESILAFQAINGVAIGTLDERVRAISEFLSDCADGVENARINRKEIEAKEIEEKKKAQRELEEGLVARRIEGLLKTKTAIETEVKELKVKCKPVR